MRTGTLIITLLFVCLVLNQKAVAQEKRTLKEVIKLQIEAEGGANGASVAWNPVQKKYYAAMAGNAEYPMGVFDEKGKLLSPKNLATMVDVRGLWYNTHNKKMQTNCYDVLGWAQYQLDGKGIPVSTSALPFTSTQPDPQSVGAYDAKHNTLYFFDVTSVSVEPHSAASGLLGNPVPIKLGKTSGNDTAAMDPNVINKYNENAIIFTGVPKGEIGLLNADDRQIELYDLATGLLTRVLALPEGAPVQTSLNFSYSNGIYWLFDKAERVWHGYKMS